MFHLNSVSHYRTQYGFVNLLFQIRDLSWGYKISHCLTFQSGLIFIDPKCLQEVVRTVISYGKSKLLVFFKLCVLAIYTRYRIHRNHPDSYLFCIQAINYCVRSLYFQVNTLRNNSILLTPNVAALSCGCKPRIHSFIV